VVSVHSRHSYCLDQRGICLPTSIGLAILFYQLKPMACVLEALGKDKANPLMV